MNAAVTPLAQLREMTSADLPAVAQIERAAYQFPWSQGIFRDCLLAGYEAIVIEDDGFVVGYGIMSVAAGDAHLLNLCVHPRYQRRGLGQRILGALLARARREEVDQVFLEVRPSNFAALELYRRKGFNEVGVRPNYYQADGGREDAIILALAFPSRREKA